MKDLDEAKEKAGAVQKKVEELEGIKRNLKICK